MSDRAASEGVRWSPPRTTLRSIAEEFVHDDPDCPACHGTGTVCEAHLDRPWDEGDGCCGAAGMPCLLRPPILVAAEARQFVGKAVRDPKHPLRRGVVEWDFHGPPGWGSARIDWRDESGGGDVACWFIAGDQIVELLVEAS